MAGTFTELERREQYAALRPYLEDARQVVSVEIDPLLQSGAKLRVEPLIYTLLVDAGLSDAHSVTGLADQASARPTVRKLFDVRALPEAPRCKHQLELSPGNDPGGRTRSFSRRIVGEVPNRAA